MKPFSLAQYPYFGMYFLLYIYFKKGIEEWEYIHSHNLPFPSFKIYNTYTA